MDPLVSGLLFLAGLTGGFIDSIAGGGGLITVPALLATGLPPAVALGTNKLQSSFGTALAVWRYARAGLTRAPGLALAVGVAGVASAVGTRAVLVLDPEILRRLVPWLLLAVAVYTAVNPRFGRQAGRARLPAPLFAVAAGGALGFYDGFFGPGTGSFWMVALVALQGLELKEATGYTKAVNLASNLGALAIFLHGGSVNFRAAGFMIAGQLLGARLGSGLVLRKGAGLIRPVFLAVAVALSLRLLWQAWLGG